MQRLTSDNFEEILFKDKQTKWIIDDTSVYRVKINKTFEGNLTTSPINGVVFIVNPNTGHLFLKVIHISVWSGPRQPNNSGKEKAVEAVTSLISTLPFTEKPKQLISIRDGLLDILDNKLLKSDPNIAIYGTSNLDCSFSPFLKVDKLNSTVLNSSESQLIFYNLYDDWLINIDSNSAFIRLMIIRKALSIDHDNTIIILNQDVSGTQPHNDHHVWPTKSNEDWLHVQSMLLEMVVNHFIQNNNTTDTIDTLSQSQIHDIIFKNNE